MLNETKNTSYEITPLTLAVMPKELANGATTTYVLEETREYTIYQPPQKVIDEACKYFGSSLQGRQDGTRDISNFTHKAPVAIDPSSGMYFFPTASPLNRKCSWISHSHIDSIAAYDYNQTEVVFKNNKRIIVDSSFGSVQNQIFRTAQFRYQLDERMKFIKKTQHTQTNLTFEHMNLHK